MKKIVFLLFIALIGMKTPIFSQNTELITDTLTQEESDQYDLLFDIDRSLMDSAIFSGPYQRRAPVYSAPYTHTVVYQTSESYSSCILIIVRSEVYANLQIQKKLIRYAEDLYYAFNKTVVIEKISNEEYTDVKALLKEYYNTKGLIGATLIGDIDYALYEQRYNLEDELWPCDLYYMDLNGQWIGDDANGIFDDHKGHLEPEIFIGRIPMSVDSIHLLSDYLDKNHDYWIGEIPIREYYGLSYINKGWGLWYKIFGMEHLYGEDNYAYYRYNAANFGAADFLDKIETNQYEFVQLAAHSNPTRHRFNDSEYLYASDIAQANTYALGYNLFCCSGCSWVNKNNPNKLTLYKPNRFLGGAYIFNQGNGLSVVGSAKTGSMLNFKYFYKPLAQGKSMGASLKKWWIDYVGSYHTRYEIHWFYGLTQCCPKRFCILFYLSQCLRFIK